MNDSATPDHDNVYDAIVVSTDPAHFFWYLMGPDNARLIWFRPLDVLDE